MNLPDDKVTLSKVEYITLMSERDAYRDLTHRMRDYFSRKSPDQFKAFTMLENVTLSQRDKALVSKGGRPS